MAFLISLVVIMGMIFIPALLKYQGQHVLPFPNECRLILHKYFDYYQNLNSKQKVRFEKKVHQFMRLKQFIPRGIESVSLEMKTLISACAVQLTFGLPYIFLRHFKRILVYPDNYYSTINHTYHKGEVNPRYGIIVLSWKAFVQGYYKKQGINLGLHEMAHALHLENVILNDESNFLDQATLREWSKLAKIEMRKIENGDNSFFRSYGSSDEHEFFAVAVENFFERPIEFKESLPGAYTVLSKLLKQDPAY